MPIFDQNCDRRFAIVCVLLQSSQVTFLNIVYSVTLLERLRQIGELYFHICRRRLMTGEKKLCYSESFYPRCKTGHDEIADFYAFCYLI